MKKTLLALSLACTTQMIAGSDCSSDCCNNACEPCCVPEPKKCIDCECYTPQYYDLQCACDFFITADFLYWFGKETGLSYALQGENVSLSLGDDPFNMPQPREVKWMKESWDPGVRVGIGGNDFCDGWDLYLYWTYFHTKKKQSTSIVGSDEFLLNPWLTFSSLTDLLIATGSQDDNFVLNETVVSARWKLDFNTIDLELGRNYWLSESFSMRPYMGVRGGWTKTRFSTQEIIAGTSEENPFSFAENANLKNKFWGAGLSGGFQPNWHLGCGFSIFGNADIALLWGCFDLDRNGSYFSESEDSDDFAIDVDGGKSQSKFSAMQAILDLAAGLRYECTFCCDSYRFALDLGWEHHIWFDHNHRNQYDTSLLPLLEGDDIFFTLDEYREIYGNLVLAGLVVRARFDF